LRQHHRNPPPPVVRAAGLHTETSFIDRLAEVSKADSVSTEKRALRRHLLHCESHKHAAEQAPLDKQSAKQLRQQQAQDA
jgi:hypothetical protein